MSDPCKCENGKEGCGYGYTCKDCQIQSLTAERDALRDMLDEITNKYSEWYEPDPTRAAIYLPLEVFEKARKLVKK